MRNGYGYSAVPLGEYPAGIMSGTLAMSVRDEYPHTATYENWYLWLADL